jgi:hypothetical protein
VNIGGSVNAVFTVMASFPTHDSGRFVTEVEKVEL